jgi:ATP-dependent helicase HrpA
VGFRVRFADQVSTASRLVLMTDGLLLTEIARDGDLNRYDTIIIDEAHERSLNIDLLFGVVKQLLPRRPDMRVIVTSATLDVGRVAEFFGNAPIIEVEGRGHPVEVRYRGVADDRDDGEDPDFPASVVEAYREIITEPGESGSGDTLVFLPGEREIRDVSEALAREFPQEVEVLPLFSRMPWEQQQKIFEPGRRRRIVLATNVAETSITVPGIRSVIDSGLARISRYNPGSRLQRLPIEPIPQASAEQRKGRCGRIGPGLCIRLFDQEDFESRPLFSEPEVLRTNLSALLLRLAADELGTAEEFPFLDPPDRRALNDGYRNLQELEAIDQDRRITARGRAMARLPLDPRLGRALLESKRFKAGAELMAIVSRLSVPDPAMRAGTEAGADAAAGTGFEDQRSEFISMVKMWKAYRAARKRTRKELRLWCKEKRLSLTRLSEWENVYTQVGERAKELGIHDTNKPASYTAVHRSLLAGFCTQIGVAGEAGLYQGTRGTRFTLFPGSPLKRRRPRWVLAANLMETSRVFARTVALIEPSWIEPAARHLVKREYFAADWDDTREEVTARERISLLGLTLSSGRSVNYGPIAPEEARHIFAREALVHRRMAARPAWLQENDAAIDQAFRIEDRLRVRGLVASNETLTAHYERLLPRQISSADALDAWTRRAHPDPFKSLTLPADVIFAQAPDAAALQGLPEEVEIHGHRVAVRYRFDPDRPDDGATLQVPVLLMPMLTQSDLDRAIPGFHLPRIEALLRSLPKSVRVSLIPISETARRFVASGEGFDAPMVRLAEWLHADKGIPLNQLVFSIRSVPAHLVLKLSVLDAAGPIAHGADLPLLRQNTAARAQAALEAAARERYADAWRSFAAQDLPQQISLPTGTGTLKVFSGLAQAPSGIGVHFYWSVEEADRAHRAGLIGLARAALSTQTHGLSKLIAQDSQMLLAASPYARAAELSDAILQQTFARAILPAANMPHANLPRTRAAFEHALQSGRSELHAQFTAICSQLKSLCGEANAVRRLIQENSVRGDPEAVAEAQSHLAGLMSPARWRDLSADQLRHYARYLKAAATRWRRLAARSRDAAATLAEMQTWRAQATKIAAGFERQGRWTPQLEEFGWLIEEYRSALSAQELKTAVPVSQARLQQRCAQLQAWLNR